MNKPAPHSGREADSLDVRYRNADYTVELTLAASRHRRAGCVDTVGSWVPVLVSRYWSGPPCGCIPRLTECGRLSRSLRCLPISVLFTGSPGIQHQWPARIFSGFVPWSADSPTVRLSWRSTESGIGLTAEHPLHQYLTATKPSLI